MILNSSPSSPRALALGAVLLLAASAAVAANGPVGRRGGGSGGPGVSAIGTASIGFQMNTNLAMAPHPDGCENNPGPYITLDGSIVLGGLDARLRFSNNERGTHQHAEDITTTFELVSDAPITFSKQPSRGGVGGNPHVWLQMQDCASATPITEYIYLGRCVQGLSMVNLDLLIPALASAAVTTGQCSGAGGPNITVTGELALGGICGQLVFTNNAAFTHVHAEDVTAEIVLLEEGQKIVFAKQPPLGGAGGNPHIYLQFLSGDDTPIGDEIYLGRCNKLEP